MFVEVNSCPGSDWMHTRGWSQIEWQLDAGTLPTNHESKATSFNAIQHLVDDVALEKFEAIAPENFDSLQKWLSNHGHLNLNIDPSAFTPTQYIH